MTLHSVSIKLTLRPSLCAGISSIELLSHTDNAAQARILYL